MGSQSRKAAEALIHRSGERPALRDRKLVAAKTLIDFGSERLAALTTALGVAAAATPLAGIFRELGRSWGTRRVGRHPAYFSHVADDGAPFELAAAFSDEPPEVQVCVEPQGDPPGLVANLLAARETLARVAADLRAPLDRWSAIEDLFLPAEPAPPFTLWLGASWTASRGVLLKAYVNPNVRGREQAPGVVAEAMRRLGFAEAWGAVTEALPFSEGRAELGVFCLELNEPSCVKACLRHPHATVRELDAAARVAKEYCAGDADDFYATIARADGPFAQKPPFTEFTLRGGDVNAPSAVTLEFPLASYVDDDEEACERVAATLDAFGMSSAAYRRAIDGFSPRPLNERSGIHAHVTLGRVMLPPSHDGTASVASPTSSPRVAVYLTTEAYD